MPWLWYMNAQVFTRSMHHICLPFQVWHLHPFFNGFSEKLYSSGGWPVGLVIRRTKDRKSYGRLILPI